MAIYLIVAFIAIAPRPSFFSNIRYQNYEIEHSAVLPSEREKHLIGNLGKIFIYREDLYFLVETRKYLNAVSKNNQFLLLSRDLALYAIFNANCPTRYVTPMNIEGRFKQKSAICDLEANNINVCIYRGPGHDARFQNYWIYNHILRNGFRFTKIIGNTLFLVKLQNDPVPILDVDTICGSNGYMCAQDIGALPAAWAGASQHVNAVSLDYTIDYTDINQEKGGLRCAGKNPTIRLKFNTAISPFSIDFILITITTPNGKRHPINLNFAADDGLYYDASSIRFLPRAPENRVPTLTNLHWLSSYGIREIRIAPDNLAVGDVFSCDVKFEALLDE